MRSLYLALFGTCQELLTVLDGDTVGVVASPLCAPRSCAPVAVTLVRGLRRARAPDTFLMSSEAAGPECVLVPTDSISYKFLYTSPLYPSWGILYGYLKNYVCR